MYNEQKANGALTKKYQNANNKSAEKTYCQDICVSHVKNICHDFM